MVRDRVSLTPGVQVRSWPMNATGSSSSKRKKTPRQMETTTSDFDLVLEFQGGFTIILAGV